MVCAKAQIEGLKGEWADRNQQRTCGGRQSGRLAYFLFG